MRRIASLAFVGALALAGALAVPVAATARAESAASANPYSSAPFSVSTSPYTFGQDPEFEANGTVIWGQDLKTGSGTQLYTAAQNGSQRTCLTCDTPGPNNVPIVQPHGDWILYHSWRGHYITFGSPGYGGLGSALWVMHPNGSDKTQLTETATGPFVNEGYDDYHAYWSPDGKQVVWTHLNYNFVDSAGQGKWDVRVADFSVSPAGVPKLTNVRVVRPANGHWYETQWWAPDGSGFLYTETTGTTVATQLFFCRLTSSGCDVTQLTNYPAWNEQAIFTPDGKDVIFMSSRDHPGFFNTFVQAAQDADLTSSEDYLLILPIFEATYFQPIATESTDLYELDLATGSVRRLTTDGNDGWIIPEFAFNPTNGTLWWTELRYPPGLRVQLPVNVTQQLNDEGQFLSNPGISPTTPGGNVNATVPTQLRTRILRFELPATPTTPTATKPCTASLTVRLHHSAGHRVVKVVAYVNSHRVLLRKGHALTSIRIKKPRAKHFTLKIITTQDNGARRATTRKYAGCAPSQG